jgi:hypothetical protein
MSRFPKEVLEIYQRAEAAQAATTHAWEQLVERYKDDRRVCNCGEAWYARPTDTMSVWDGQHWQFDVKPSHDRVCMYGCQANKYQCKLEVARRVLEEF